MTYVPGKSYTNLPVMSTDDAEILFQNVDAIVEVAGKQGLAYRQDDVYYLIPLSFIEQARYSRNQVRERWYVGTPLSIARDKLVAATDDLNRIIRKEQVK